MLGVPQLFCGGGVREGQTVAGGSAGEVGLGVTKNQLQRSRRQPHLTPHEPARGALYTESVWQLCAKRLI